MHDPKNLTIVVSPGMADAAIYDGNALVAAGHYDEMAEKVFELVGVTVEYDTDIIADKTARGWAGVAKTLDQLR